MIKHAKASLVAIFLTMSLGAGNIFASDTIKIGIAGPHTGNNAAFGEQLWHGSEKAAADINKAGGINGKKIELVKGDDACEPKQAVNVANRLVEKDNVVAVIGHFCSSSTIPASEIYNEAGVLMITPASTNPQVTDRKLRTILRTCGRDDQQGAIAADFLMDDLKLSKVAVLHDKDTYGKGLADAFKARLKERNPKFKEVLYEGLTRGEKDFRALVTKIKSVGAEAVYFGGLQSEAGPLVRQMRELGIDAPFISGDGIVSSDFVTAAGGANATQGVYMTFSAEARNISAGKKVVEEFRTAMKYEPEGYTLYSYATMEAIAAALKNNKKHDGKTLATWLENNPVDTVVGTLAWDKKGDLKKSNYVIYRWDKQGKYAELDKKGMTQK